MDRDRRIPQPGGPSDAESTRRSKAKEKPTPVFWQALKTDVWGSLYALVAAGTTTYLILFDDSVYTTGWWNWIVADLVDLGEGVFWPLFLAIALADRYIF